MTTHNNSMPNLASKEHGSDFLFFCGMVTVQVSMHHSQDATPGICSRIILAALTRATTIHTMGYSYWSLPLGFEIFMGLDLMGHSSQPPRFVWN